jgi:mono/diheme cytochrome c family protein
VKPIFDSPCVQCHGANLAFKNVKLDTYAGAKANANSSYQQIVDGNMPQGGRKLTPAEKAAILDWINGGLIE